jgi:hypothetical protein
MTNDDIIKTRAKAAADLFRAHLIRDLRASIAANERALERFSRVLLGHGYVVQNGHGDTITFDSSADGLAVNPHMTSPGAAMRFTENKANELARVTHDGTGLPFKAVHVIDALKRQIAADRRMLVELAGLEPSRAPALVKTDDDGL